MLDGNNTKYDEDIYLDIYVDQARYWSYQHLMTYIGTHLTNKELLQNVASIAIIRPNLKMIYIGAASKSEPVISKINSDSLFVKCY